MATPSGSFVLAIIAWRDVKVKVQHTGVVLYCTPAAESAILDRKCMFCGLYHMIPYTYMYFQHRSMRSISPVVSVEFCTASAVC